jgi:hypothetical protein
VSAQLTLDELDLLPTGIIAALASPGYYFEATADGTEWRNAEAVISSVTSELFEGAAIDVTGYEALTATVTVRVVGIDRGHVDTGAAVLVEVCRREAMKSLTYVPADGTAPPTVFDVLAVTWDSVLNDIDELQKTPRRTYELTLHCKPFPRSADLVTVPAVSIATTAPTITSIDTGSSTTGWSTTSKSVARTNLITNGNFEYGSQGWVKGANTDRVVWDSDGMRWAVRDRDDGRSHINYQTPMKVTAGTSYRLHMEIYQANPTFQLGLLIRWYNASGVQIGTDASNTIAVTLGSAGTWRTLSTTRTAPTGAVTLGFFPFAQYDSSSGAAYSGLRKVHVETNSTWGAAFDGDTPTFGTTEYVWSGAAGRSTSFALVPTTPSTSGGKVNVAAYGGRSLSLRRSGTIDMSVAHWLRLRGTWSGTLTLNVEVSGGDPVPSITPQALIRSGSTFDAYFAVPSDSITAFSLSTNAGSSSLQSATLSVDQVDTSTGLPLTGTGRSGDFIADAYGTMPAEASIEIQNTADLGRMVLIFTRPASLGVGPALRARRIAGPSVTAASTNISGFSEVLTSAQSGSVTWEFDAADLPAASYLLAARLSATGLTSGNGYVLNWRAYMVLDGATETSIYSGNRTIKAASTTWGSGTGERITEIALLTLPTQNVLASGDASAKVRIQLWVTGGGTWNLDESWIFDTDKGDVSVIEPVSALHRLRLVPASADRPVQAYLAEYEPTPGNVTTRDISDNAIGWSQHKVDPRDGELAIYVATLTTTPALTAEVEYYPRWDVYAAPLQIEEATA